MNTFKIGDRVECETDLSAYIIVELINECITKLQDTTTMHIIDGRWNYKEFKLVSTEI